MPTPSPSDSRGIVHAREGQSLFQLDRHAPGDALTPWIEYLWEVSYELPESLTHDQMVLSFPNVHLTFERENGQAPVALVYGIPERPYVRHLGACRSSGREFSLEVIGDRVLGWHPDTEPLSETN